MRTMKSSDQLWLISLWIKEKIKGACDTCTRIFPEKYKHNLWVSPTAQELKYRQNYKWTEEKEPIEQWHFRVQNNTCHIG